VYLVFWPDGGDVGVLHFLVYEFMFACHKTRAYSFPGSLELFYLQSYTVHGICSWKFPCSLDMLMA
jgi:hypothetical protein